MQYNDLPKISRALASLIMSLKRKKYRRSEGLSTAEGIRLIEEALNADIPLHSAVFTLDAMENHPQLLTAIKDKGIEIFKTAPAEMERLSPLKSPPGCLVVYKTDYEPPAREGNLIVACHKISDPGNLGTVIRAADWFGVSKLILSDESAELHNPSTVRGSMGSVFRMPSESGIDLTARITELKSEGYKVAVALTRGGEKPAKTEGRTILVTGDEYGELPPELEEIADYCYTIPKRGQGESLNLAAAASILLYAMTEG